MSISKKIVFITFWKLATQFWDANSREYIILTGNQYEEGCVVVDRRVEGRGSSDPDQQAGTQLFKPPRVVQQPRVPNKSLFKPHDKLHNREGLFIDPDAGLNGILSMFLLLHTNYYYNIPKMKTISDVERKKKDQMFFCLF